MKIFTPSVHPGWPGRDATLTITLGLPGCGKSTAARQWAAVDPDHRVIIARDALREMIGCMPVGSSAQEAAIQIILHTSVEALLRQGWDVLVDSTHLQPGMVAGWRQLSSGLGVRMEILDLTDIGPEECIARNAARVAAGGRHVEPEVIWEIWRRWRARPGDTVETRSRV